MYKEARWCGEGFLFQISGVYCEKSVPELELHWDVHKEFISGNWPGVVAAYVYSKSYT